MKLHYYQLRTLVVILVTFTVGGHASSSMIMESFSYTAGTSLAGANGGIGFSGPWSVPDFPDAQAVVAGLTHSLQPGSGSAWGDTNPGFRPNARRLMDPAALGGLFNVGTNSIEDGQTVWFSFLINFNNGVGDFRVKLFGSIPVPDTNSFFTGTGVRFNYVSPSDGFQVGFEYANTEVGTKVTGLDGGSTHLIVGSLEAVSGENDIARIWINPASLASAAALGAPSLTYNGQNFTTSGNLLYIRGNNAGTAIIDEFRVMTAIPEPSTYAALFGFMGLVWAVIRRPRTAH